MGVKADSHFQPSASFNLPAYHKWLMYNPVATGDRRMV